MILSNHWKSKGAESLSATNSLLRFLRLFASKTLPYPFAPHSRSFAVNYFIEQSKGAFK